MGNVPGKSGLTARMISRGGLSPKPRCFLLPRQCLQPSWGSFCPKEAERAKAGAQQYPLPSCSPQLSSGCVTSAAPCDFGINPARVQRRASCAGRSRAGWAPTPRCRIRPSTSPHRTQASVEGDQCLISEPGTTEPRKRGARGISQLQAPSPGCCSSSGVLCSCLLLTFLILTNQFMFLVCITRLGFFFFNFNSNPSH